MTMTWQQFATPYLKKQKSGGLKAASKAWKSSPQNPANAGKGGGGGGGSSASKGPTRAAVFKKIHRGLYGLTVFQLMTSTTARQQLADLIDELQAGSSGGTTPLPGGPGGGIYQPGGGSYTSPVSGESVLETFDRIQDTGYGEDMYAMDLLSDFDFYGFFDMLFENIVSSPGDFVQIIRNAMSEPGIEGKLKGAMAVVEKYPGPAMSAIYVIDTALGHDAAEVLNDFPVAGTTIEKIESKVPKKFDPGKYARMLK